MNRLTLIIIVCSIVVVFLTLLVLVYVRSTNQPTQETVPTPTATPPTIPPLPTSTTIESSGVEINNPFTGAREYTTRGDALMVKTETHSIVYLKDFDEFLITINKEPFEENRTLAENNFLIKLGISREEACRLKVSVVPPEIEGELTPRYSLSFCDE